MINILAWKIEKTKFKEIWVDIPMEIKLANVRKAICILCTMGPLWIATPNASFGQQTIESVQKRIAESTLRAHIRFLADDLLEGRGPASQGDAFTQLYLETQFQANGLEIVPAVGSYRQVFPMLGLTSTPDNRWEIQAKNGESVKFEYFKDFIAVAGRPDPKIAIKDAELVFVGYGIQAPEFQWDDYKAMDLKGKILVIRVSVG